MPGDIGSVVGLVGPVTVYRDLGVITSFIMQLLGVAASDCGPPLAAILPGAWRYRISARTGWPVVSVLGDIACLICDFFVSVPSLTYV